MKVRAELPAPYNYFRNYDPTLGRYVQSDLVGLRGGVSTYAYVGGRPLGAIDFYGLDIAIITGGIRDGSVNMFGHVGAAVTGFGMASYGNDTSLGSSANLYVAQQSWLRDEYVTIIPTTPAQDALMLEYIKKHPNKNKVGYWDNCAARVSGMLQAAGISIDDHFPWELAQDVSSLPGATNYFVPQGSPIPAPLVTTLSHFGK